MILALLLMMGIVAAPAAGVLASSSIRATDERRRIHRQLGALANTSRRPPGALFTRVGEHREKARTFGGALAHKCGCPRAAVDRRRIAWGFRNLKRKAQAAMRPDGTCDPSACSSGGCAR